MIITILLLTMLTVLFLVGALACCSVIIKIETICKNDFTKDAEKVREINKLLNPHINKKED